MRMRRDGRTQLLYSVPQQCRSLSKCCLTVSSICGSHPPVPCHKDVHLHLLRNFYRIANVATAAQFKDFLPFQPSLTQDVVRHDSALFATLEIIAITDVKPTQVVECGNAGAVKGEDASRFIDEWNLDGVKSEANSLASSKDATEDAGVVG